MSLLDWLFVCIPFLVVAGAAIWTKRYVRDVADFLAAGRAGGRYLVCNAEGAAAMGAVSVIAICEQYYNGGVGAGWWGILLTPVMLLITLTGFIIYRYRETRVLTMAEFFERRYSRRFRVFMGILAFGSGILNFGIFPAVGARFIVYFCNWPDHLSLGGFGISTFALVMFVILSVNVCFAITGGQLTAMVTDSIEGIISSVLFVFVGLTLLFFVGIGRVEKALTDRPPGESFINPFDISRIDDFNLGFALIGIFLSAYSYMAWQGNQGFNASALNAHEARMGRILGSWRTFARGGMIGILAICAYTLLHHVDFAATAQGVHERISGIDAGAAVQKQMTVPIALSEALQSGAKGALLAIILFMIMACDTSYMHSWGSIFIQDVVLPLRRKHLDPASHIRWLRLAIIGVAIFAFLFSFFFHQTEYILMYFAITGAIFLGGAGSVIIGGLYWNRGTESAAWSSMIVGAVLSVAGIVIRQVNPEFPLNGQVLALIAALSAIITYISVSLLTCRDPHNMEKLLNRGAYAVDADGIALPEKQVFAGGWSRLIGVDELFSRGDRLQSYAIFGWSVFWFILFVGGTIWNFISPWPQSWWWNYVLIVHISLPILVGLVTGIWFSIGGIRDLLRLFRRLKSKPADPNDDGEMQ
ncbi:MAG: sodium:solute symporter family protein [Chthoniobacterales bacterium]